MSSSRLGSTFQVRGSGLILAVALLHITVVVGIFLTGRFGILPNTFDRYGIGTSFAIDSKSYRIEAEDLADSLRKGRISEWQSNPRLHVKLYSICFAVLDRVLGPNILSAEPLNLTSYLLVLALVYAVGREVFDQKVGLLAAGAVAVWPSFLLYTTQMLRDPLFILAMLLLLSVLAILVNRDLSWQRGLAAGVTGAMACFFLWLIRGDWWEMLFVVVAVGVGISVLKQLLAARLQGGNALSALLILVAGLTVPLIVPTYRQSEDNLRELKETGVSRPIQLPPTIQPNEPTWDKRKNSSLWSRVPERIGLLRHNFIVRYPLAGSNIDTEVELNGLKDTIQYMPRAIMIGLFSPFPNMWFSRGAQVGLVGRLVAGAETFVTYIIQILAVISILIQRRRFAVWLLLSTVVVGVIGLAYVVVNISALYRMRYVFWMLIVILGASGLLEIRTMWLAKREVRNPVAVA